jgi:cytochrome d ubiquinol oxidase subunit II
MDFQTLWFILVSFMLIGYAVLDGFDLGAGVLYLSLKKDEDRRIVMGAIGPVWDGNEVWLVTGGGALFAAFPQVYATVFSGFYLAFVLFLLALILRATALEFRNKEKHPTWRKTCDTAFAIGSTLAALLLGVAFGNIVRGLPIGPDMEFTGTFLGLLNPFSLLFGLASVFLLGIHGACFLAVKSEGELQKRFTSIAARGARVLPMVLLALFIFTALGTDLLRQSLMERPYLAAAALGSLLAAWAIRSALRESPWMGLLLSSSTIALSLIFFLSALYPNCVYCPGEPANSLTIANASSSIQTLHIMAWIALLTVPFVLFYTVWVYRIFKGPAKSDSHGY